MENERRRIVVTGAAGFVGSHLVESLASDGYEVHAIVRASSQTDHVRSAILHIHDGHSETLKYIMETVRPLAVIHLASHFVAEHRTADIEPMLESQIVFSTQLVDAMASAGVRFLINTGTSWQHYGDEQYNPACLYAATKEAFAAIVDFYVRARSIQCVTLELYDTYGPGDRRPKLLNVMHRAMKSGATLALSPGEQLLNLVHIDDVVAAYECALARLLSDETSGCETFSVRSPEHVSLKQLVALYSQLADRSLSVLWGGRPYREREIMHPYEDGVILPDWHSQVTLVDGLRQLIRFQDAADV
ncbi:MAG: NAD-dependent epimerase/dehydratase family protein [Bacilli bacterium]